MRYIIIIKNTCSQNGNREGRKTMGKTTKYIKLVAINVGDFESEIVFERNYPDTESGEMSCNKDKRMCERKGFICNSIKKETPVLGY